MKVTRRLSILARDDIHPRQKGMILNDFTENRIGILYIDEWMQLISLVKSYYVKKRIFICVSENLQRGRIFWGKHMLEKPQQEFLAKVSSVRR
jgi:hypothetical protein